MAESTPLEDLVVNDRYWLGRAREMVTASVRGRDEAGRRLATAIGWFWTVYTSAALVGVALANRALPAWLAWLLALPALLLVAAYALVIWALNPIRASFDPRVPEEIALAHTQASEAKKRRLAAATACTLTAALAVAVAVAATAVTKPERTPSLRAAYSARGDGMSVILVRGQFTPGQEVTITVTPGMVAGAKPQPIQLLQVASQGGSLGATIPIPIARSYSLTAAWNDRTGRWELTRTITPSKGTTST